MMIRLLPLSPFNIHVRLIADLFIHNIHHGQLMMFIANSRDQIFASAILSVKFKHCVYHLLVHLLVQTVITSVYIK